MEEYKEKQLIDRFVEVRDALNDEPDLSKLASHQSQLGELIQCLKSSPETGSHPELKELLESACALDSEYDIHLGNIRKPYQLEFTRTDCGKDLRRIAYDVHKSLSDCQQRKRFEEYAKKWHSEWSEYRKSIKRHYVEFAAYQKEAENELCSKSAGPPHKDYVWYDCSPLRTGNPNKGFWGPVMKVSLSPDPTKLLVPRLGYSLKNDDDELELERYYVLLIILHDWILPDERPIDSMNPPLALSAWIIDTVLYENDGKVKVLQTALDYVKNDLAKNPNGLGITEAAGNKPASFVANKKRPKAPSKEANQAYELLNSTGWSQEKVAEEMTKQLNPEKPYQQYHVSRWVKEVEAWRKDNNLPVESTNHTPNKVTFMAPEVLDMGARIDGMPTGDPRNPKKSLNDLDNSGYDD